jgi:hypothetical protein
MPQVDGRQPTREEWMRMTDAERVAALTPEELAATRELVAELPDYVVLSYPFDVPPHRMPLAQYVLGKAGAWRHCPEARCRRSRSCRGGKGPPCFRADRADLQQVLFLTHMLYLEHFSAEDVEFALTRQQNRYAVFGITAQPSFARRPGDARCAKDTPRRA